MDIISIFYNSTINKIYCVRGKNYKWNFRPDLTWKAMSWSVQSIYHSFNPSINLKKTKFLDEDHNSRLRITITLAYHYPVYMASRLYNVPTVADQRYLVTCDIQDLQRIWRSTTNSRLISIEKLRWSMNNGK